MPKQMVQPKINEVSLVDHPAHLTEGWLFMCSDDPATANLLLRAEAIAKGVDPDTLIDAAKGSDMPKISEEVRKALTPEALAYVEALEKAAEDKPAVAVTKTVEPVLTEAEQFEKAMAEVPEPVRKVMIDQQRRTAAAEALAKSLYDEREDAKFAAVAKSLTHVATANETDFAKSLRAAATAAPEATAVLVKALTAANTAVEKSALFVEIGSAAPAAGSGQEALEGIAKALVTSTAGTDKPLSYPEAIAKAAEAHPELYIQHRGEMNRANSGAA